VSSPTPRPSFLTTTLVAVGLLCCIYLAALKVMNLPCALSGCSEIIGTRYGSLLGIPLPVLALPLWLLLTIPGDLAWIQRAQFLSSWFMAAGCLALMVIQFGVLHGFCPFCTVHAVSAVATAFALRKRGRAHAWLPAVMLALTFPLLMVVKAETVAHVESWQAAPAEPPPGGSPAQAAAPSRPAIPASIDQVAFHWLGEFDAKESPILVVSFQCAHCLDLLERVVARPRIGTLKGPKIFVYSQPTSANDTIAILAAMLSVSGTQEEQFSALLGQMEVLRDPLVTRDSKELKNRLAELFPRYTEKLTEARQQYNMQVTALRYIPGRGSPYLLLPDGSNRFGDIPVDLLFH